MNAGFDGSWVAVNEPSALERFTTIGFAERRRSGSAASVARIVPTAFVSNTASAWGPSCPHTAMPALFTRTSSPPFAATCAKAAATEASSRTSSCTERAPISAATAAPCSASRAPIQTV